MGEAEKKPRPALVMCLAQVLTELYKERNLTQEGIAKEAKIARGTVIRALTIGRVTIPNLQRICNIMKVPVSEVFVKAELKRKNAPR